MIRKSDLFLLFQERLNHFHMRTRLVPNLDLRKGKLVQVNGNQEFVVMWNLLLEYIFCPYLI